MSSNIEDRIVRMQFDDKGFEAGAAKAIDMLGKLDDALKFEDAGSALSSIQNSMSRFSADGMTDALHSVGGKFSWLGTIAFGFLSKLGADFEAFALSLPRKMTSAITAGARDGWQEYNLQMKSVQTIQANSGASLKTIQENLDTLNEYADKTTYVFSDMTSAIGRFTAAGIGVEKSTVAVQGFFNAAALAGADASAASRGVYQLSQAMSAGVVKLQDWKSIENASIDTEKFREIIILTAQKMGVATDNFKKLTNGEISFRQSLEDGWLTANVMQNALENLTYSTLDYADEQEGVAALTKQLVKNGYTEEQAKQIIQVATAADRSAREIRTYGQMMDTLKESIGSGWAQTWRLIIGDFKESAEFFTWFSEKLMAPFTAISNARNKLVEDWKKAGGRDSLVNTIATIIEGITRIVTPIVDAFSAVFTITGEHLAELTARIGFFFDRLVLDGEQMQFLNDLFFSLFNIIKDLGMVSINIIDILREVASVVWLIIGPVVRFAFNMIGSLVERLSVFTKNLVYVSSNISWAVMKVAKPIRTFVQGVKLIISSFFEAMKNAFSGTVIGDFFARWINRFKDFYENWSDVTNRLAKPVRFITALFNRINAALFGKDAYLNGTFDNRWLEFFEGFWKIIAKFVDTPFSFIYAGFIRIREGIKSLFSILSSAASFASPGFFWLIDVIKNLAGTSIGGILSSITSILPTVATSLMSLLGSNGLMGGLSSLAGMTNLSGWVDTLTEKFNGLVAPAEGAGAGIKEFIIASSKSIVTKGKNTVVSIASTLSETFRKLVAYFKQLSSGNGSISAKIKTVFGDAYNALHTWLGKMAEGATGFGSLIAGAFQKLLEVLRNVPNYFRQLFGIAQNTTEQGVQNAKQAAEDFKQNASDFWTGLLEKLPDIGDIKAKIGEFITGFKESFSSGLSGMFSGGIASFLGKDSLLDALDLSGLSIKFPDWKQPFADAVEYITGVLDAVPDDRIKEITSNLATAAKNIGGIGFAFSGWKFLNSLTELNKGLGASGEGLGAFLTQMPTAISTIFTSFGKDFGKSAGDSIKGGLTSIGEGLKNLGQNTIFRPKMTVAFKNVAAGLIMLAGALWVISRVPAEDLERAGMAVTKLGVGVLGFVGIMVILSKFADLKGMSGVGIAIAGLGFALLSMAGVVWLMGSVLTEDQIKKGMTCVLLLMVFLSVCTSLIAAVSAESGLSGAGFALVGMALAINLMIAPILLLGWLFDKHMNLIMNGLSIVVLIEALYAGVFLLFRFLTASGKDLALASVMMVTLTACIAALVAPILILGALEKWASKGFLLVAGIAAVLAGCVMMMSWMASSGMDLALASVALIAMSVAIGLVSGILIVLGALHDVAASGLLIFGWIALVLAGCITMFAAVAEQKASLVGGGAAMILLAIAIDLVAGALLLLGALQPVAQKGVGALILIGVVLTAMVFVLSNFTGSLGMLYGAVGAMAILTVVIAAMGVVFAGLGVIVKAVDAAGAYKKTIGALAAIVASLTVIAGVGSWLGGGLLALSGAFLVFSAGLIALFTALMMAEDVNWGFIVSGLQSIWDAFSSSHGGQIIIGFANGILGALDILGQIAQLIYDNFIGPFLALFGIHSPSTVMEENGELTMEGFVNGVENYLGEVTDTGTDAGQEFLNSFKDIAGNMGEIGGEGVESFLEGFDTDELATTLGTKTDSAINSFLDGIDTDALAEKGADMIAGLLEGMVKDLPAKMFERAKLVFTAFTNPLALLFNMNSPSLVMEEYGENIIQGLINGLGNLVTDLGVKAGEVGLAILNGLGPAGQFISAGLGLVSGIGSGINGGLPGVGVAAGGISTAVTGAVSGLEGKMSAYGLGGASAFSGSIGTASKSANVAMFATVLSVASKAGELTPKLRAKGSEGAGGLVSGITSKTGAARTAAAGLVSAASSSIGSLYDKFYSVGRNGAYGMMDGMSSMIASIARKAAEMAQAAVNAATATLKEKSPSKVFREIGEYVGEGFVIGISSGVPEAYAAGKELASQIPDSFTDSLSAMSVDIEDILDTDYNPVITPVINSATFDSNLDYIAGMLDSKLNGNLYMDGMNYNQQFAGKFDSMAESNQQMMDRMSANAIDYNLLGAAVAEALIASGVRVEMDGGQLMGYLAGEIVDARRMYG